MVRKTVAERVEIVVNGRRREALPVAPKFARRTSPSGGFLAEDYHLSTFELPDCWIPYYMVGLQFTRGVWKRHFLENGKPFEEIIQPDDCHVVSPREARRFRIEGEGRVCLVSIEPAVLQEMIAGSPYRDPLELIRTRNGQDPTLKGLLLQLQADLAAGCPSGPLFGESLCVRITETIVQRYSLGRTRLDEYKGGLSGARLRLTLEYIDENLGLDLDGDSIAAVSGLSKYHFGKAFKQSTGMTLHNYVLSRRMRRGQELLVQTDHPLAAVAEASGFSNQSHFTSLFTTRLGIAPRAYRQTRRRLSLSFHTNEHTLDSPTT
jgi:AraC family transcriptional regulator